MLHERIRKIATPSLLFDLFSGRGNDKNDLLYRHLYRQSGKSGFPTGVQEILLFYHDEVVVCIRRDYKRSRCSCLSFCFVFYVNV